MRSSLGAALALAMLAGLSQAQSFAFNLDASDGSVPSSNFGAFAGQAGFWDAIQPNMNGYQMLTDTSGAPTDVFYQWNAINPHPISTQTNFGGTPISLDTANLFSDYSSGIPNNQIRIRNLAPGTYRFFTYAWTPGGLSRIHVHVQGQFPGGCRWMNHGTVFPPTEFQLGTFCAESGNAPANVIAKTLTVGAGETVILTALCGGVLLPGGSVIIGGGIPPGGAVGSPPLPPNPLYCSIAGLQIVPVTGIQGCAPTADNSVGGKPRINAFGTRNAAGAFDTVANDITLSCGSLPGALPPGQQILTYASNGLSDLAAEPQPSCGGALGAGSTRCLGPGNYVQLLSNGYQTSSFGVYNIDVDLNALAAQGLIVDGSRPLYFQMLYEDNPVPGLDPCNAGPILRWSRSLTVQLF